MNEWARLRVHTVVSVEITTECPYIYCVHTETVNDGVIGSCQWSNHPPTHATLHLYLTSPINLQAKYKLAKPSSDLRACACC